MEDIEKDPRFAHTARDPRFKPNYKQKKVKIDSRFKSMLQDKEFNIKFLDKRGRPINSATKEDLRRLYQYESDSEEEKDSSEDEKSEAEESDREESSGREEEQDENDDDDAESSETEDEREASEEREEEKDQEAEEDVDDSTSKGEPSDDDFPDLTTEDAPDYARGVGILESSDDDQASEDEDDGEEEEEEEQEEEGILDHNWNEPDHNAPEAEEVTSRLALCNMDWDRIKARDLYVLFTSFVPQDGAVQSVTIYPSELGREKMAEEEKLGPREFREKDNKGDDSRIGKLNPAKLRQYQLNRLAYYYAVIVCDSKETANKLYEECDSMEYEKSACRVDLRFIPEDMTFEETPKDSCTGVSDLSKFKPSTFTTTALCQAKVQVTWDETSIERLTKTMQKKFTEEDLGSNKFDELIASSSEDSSEEETDSKRQRKKKNKKDVKTYRKLLGLEDDKAVKEKDGDSQTSGEESEKDEDEEMLFSAKIGSGSEDEEEVEGHSEDEEEVEGHSEDEEEQKLDTVKTESRKTEKTKKKDKKKKKEKQNGQNQNSDVSADEEEVEGEMQYTWQPSANPKMLKTQARKKLTPWEDYQQKKKDKKKEKKRERKQQRLREQGIEDTTDLGFDDEFFNDEPAEEPTKKKKKERKKKRQQEETKEESEADRKDRASLALLMKDEDNDHNHFSLMQIMKEESEGKKKKGKKRKQAEAEAVDSFEMKLDHSRFGSLYTDPNMHIDPNAPEFKKTKGMMTLMEQVSKKRKTVHNAW